MPYDDLELPTNIDQLLILVHLFALGNCSGNRAIFRDPTNYQLYVAHTAVDSFHLATNTSELRSMCELLRYRSKSKPFTIRQRLEHLYEGAIILSTKKKQPIKAGDSMVKNFHSGRGCSNCGAKAPSRFCQLPPKAGPQWRNTEDGALRVGQLVAGQISQEPGYCLIYHWREQVTLDLFVWDKLTGWPLIDETMELQSKGPFAGIPYQPKRKGGQWEIAP